MPQGLKPVLHRTYYLTGHSSPNLLAKRDRRLGLMAQPGNYGSNTISQWPIWAADNGCFSKGDSFDPAAWLMWLSKQRRDTCLFAVAPDVLGDAAATWKRSLPYFAVLRAWGFKPAFVAQDGFDPNVIDWDQFDVLFIGGTTDFKLGIDGELAVKEAKARGKKVHVGRVNSRKRYQQMKKWGADSVDGTYLAYGPDVNFPKLLNWF